MILRDYRCESCEWEFESLERKGDTTIACPECSAPAHAMFPCPKLGTVWGAAVTRGENQDPPKGAVDTRELGSTDPKNYYRARREWKKKRRLQRIDARRKEFGIESKPFSLPGKK